MLCDAIRRLVGTHDEDCSTKITCYGCACVRVCVNNHNQKCVCVNNQKNRPIIISASDCSCSTNVVKLAHAIWLDQVVSYSTYVD